MAGVTSGPTPDRAIEEEHSPGRPAPAPAATRPRASLVAAGELLRALGVTQPLISQHLRVLKSAGVVDGERHGREVVYRLVDEHLSHIVVDAVTHVEE